MSRGHLYILKNPSFNPNRLKIGRTEKEIETRSTVLSAPTGVPTPYQIVYQTPTVDCVRAEKEVADRLTKFRVSDKREFFDIEPKEAIRVVMEVVEAIDAEHTMRVRNPCMYDIFAAVRDWFRSGVIKEMGGDEIKVRLYWLLRKHRDGEMFIDLTRWTEDTGLDRATLSRVFDSIEERETEDDPFPFVLADNFAHFIETKKFAGFSEEQLKIRLYEYAVVQDAFLDDGYDTVSKSTGIPRDRVFQVCSSFNMRTAAEQHELDEEENRKHDAEMEAERERKSKEAGL